MPKRIVKKETLFKLVAVVLALCAALLIAEGAARIFPAERLDGNFVRYLPGNKRRYIPNTKGIVRNHGISDLDVHIRINSLGFRGEELAAAKPGGETRILFLGDSITAADYLQEEDTFVVRVGRYLRKSIPDRNFKVVNGGLRDIGLTEAREILEEIGLKTHPDIVVVGFYLNDSRPSWGFANELGSAGFLRRNSVLVDLLYRKAVLRSWIEEHGEARFPGLKVYQDLNWRSDKRDFLELVSHFKYDWGAAWDKESWVKIEEEILRIKELARKHDFSLVIVSFPVAYQVYAEILADAPQREMRKICEKHGLPCLDLLPLFRSHNKENLFFDHCHPKERGNDLVGRAIAEFIQREVIQAQGASGSG